MKYFPIFLDLKGKLCAVVGGGRVAERKVRTLLKAGARVKVISPELTEPLSRLKTQAKILGEVRPFQAGDLRGAFLAIAATDDRKTNEKVYRQALRKMIPVNVVDDPVHSSFIVPSIVQRGDLVVAISTSGQSPALARTLRQKFEKEIGPEYALALEFMGQARRKILSLSMGTAQKQRILRRLAAEDFLSLIINKRFPALHRRLRNLLGPDFSLKELKIEDDRASRKK